MPNVSICIPVYNMEAFIGIAIESALKQMYENFEVIVCDNASTDNTMGIVSSFKDIRLIVKKSETNIGMIRNFNRCIELSSGEYIKFLEADDMLEKDCLKKMVELAEKYPNVGIISCGRTLIDVRSKKIGGHNKERTEVIPGEAIVSRIRRMGNEIGTPTDVLIRRSVLDSTGLFDLNYDNYLNDWDLWIRIAEKSDVGFIAEALSRVRRHPEQVGAIGARSTRDIDVGFIFIKKLEERWKKSSRNFGIDISFLYIHFTEEFLWRGLFRVLKYPGKQSLSFLKATIIRIKDNVGFNYFIISVLYAFLHLPVFIGSWYHRKAKNSGYIKKCE